MTRLEKQGVVQTFEFTHELAWKVLKDFLEDQGEQNIRGSKDATRAGFKVLLIREGELWMAMIQSRNISSHTYDEATAESLVVNGFIEPIVKELPLEYALEMNRLIQLQMEGSVG